MKKTVAIVGAGAKAAAIVARAAILRDLGVPGTPDIVVFESDHVGSAWSGHSRFSSGFLTLCTPGEKDIGFPYIETARRGGVRAPVSPALFARFSWTAFLVATGRLPDWVDREREHPTHREWARYLAWVIAEAKQPVTYAKVTKARPFNGRWDITAQDETGTRTVAADAIVLTGTGPPRSIRVEPGIPDGRLFDAESFWAARDTIAALPAGAVAVAGDGGAAGTIVAWLAGQFAEKPVSVFSISPMGTLFPRGDGYAERRWFSDPSDWRELTVDHRRKLIERTEAGVVSIRIKRAIDASPKVEYRWGRVVAARWQENEIRLGLEYEAKPAAACVVDYLVTAIGFDSWGLLGLIDHPAASRLQKPENKALRAKAELALRPDLSLPQDQGYPPGLHVPALGGLAHGPGMSNLGCLGLMAARVLRPYIED